MSNKPKIYATCKAGCLWETIHRSEFEKAMPYIPIAIPESGEVFLEVGSNYQLFKQTSYVTTWGMTIVFKVKDLKSGNEYEVNISPTGQSLSYQQIFMYASISEITTNSKGNAVINVVVYTGFQEGVYTGSTIYSIETNETPTAADFTYSISAKGMAKVRLCNGGNIYYEIKCDTEMSDTSENPVQNKIIKKYIDEAIAKALGGE